MAILSYTHELSIGLQLFYQYFFYYEWFFWNRIFFRLILFNSLLDL